MPRVRVVILATFLALGAIACGNRHLDRGRAHARAGRIEEAVRELRAAVAANPGDGDARIELGRLELEAGRPGAAIRQFEAALAIGEDRVRPKLGWMLMRRAFARRDRDRYLDLLRGGRLAPERAGDFGVEWRTSVLMDGGAARWAAGDREGAREILAEMASGEMVLEAVMSPEKAHLEVVELAASSLYTQGGARVALPLLEAYERRSGDNPVLLALAATARSELDPASAPPLEPDALAETIFLALGEWLGGRRDAWIDAELVALVEREAGTRPIGDFPIWIRPTIHRLRGETAQATAALRDVPGDLPENGKIVVAFELAAAGDVTAAQALLDTSRPVGEEAERVLGLAQLTLGALAADEARVEQALAIVIAPSDLEDPDPMPLRGELAGLVAAGARRSPGAVRAWGLAPRVGKDLRVTLRRQAAPFIDAERLGTWEKKASASAVAPLGTQPRRTLRCRKMNDGPRCYEEVERAIRRDAVAGAQAARDWIDRDLAFECRTYAVVGLYLQLGDHARIVPLLEELLAIAPANFRALRLMALSAVRAKNPRRALSYLQEAEYWSPARGRESVLIAAALTEAGSPIDAIFAARQALGFADGVIRWRLHEETVVAAIAAGRLRDARTALEAYLGELPPRLHADARRRLASRTGEPWLGPDVASPRDDREAWVAGVPHDASAAVALAAAHPDRAAAILDRALLYSPWSIEALAARGSADDRARLLLIGLAAGGERAPRALDALAAITTDARVAAALRAEAAMAEPLSAWAE